MVLTKLVIKGTILLVKSLWKYWWLWITIIMLFSSMVVSVNNGIEQEDWSLPFKDLGLFLVVADEKVFEEVQDLEYEIPKKTDMLDGILNFFDFMMYVLKNIFFNLWMILFNFIIFSKFWLWILGDASKRRRAVISSIITMALLQILVLGVPFRGIYALGKFISGVMLGA